MSLHEKLSGDVSITLNGEEHILRPSLQAATSLSATFGGLSSAFDGLMKRDLGTYQAVVKAGIITAKNISTKDLHEAVWKAGMTKLSEPLVDFLGLLNNGGRKPGDDGEGGDADDNGGDGEGNGHGA